MTEKTNDVICLLLCPAVPYMFRINHSFRGSRLYFLCSCESMLLHTSSCLAFLQRSGACAAHNNLALATRVLKLSTLFVCTTLSSSLFQSTVVLWKKDFFTPLCYSGSQRKVCRCVLHSRSLD